ncbi:carboxynorspermidine decarboxylase [Thauera linaloolentis 47Lol = DSM 12138]|uniref:Carboxynorspermidine/carboxyspermidine decarboxylase n=1 Tax=Thauera linaloolentis (strain DSM 12138 / JCM 21573 / CCUG 41526 / CIP 105981 / IAM 15112 / NBRC 102519 / 47Lol) TaxID=1123367 RepID=N6XUR3_THAL4|nr:carboxynorspermidine decarboxylase [Thauera linaloolentis 47Lol = DSM 12138]
MIQTPYYLIDKSRLLKNLQRIDFVRKQSGAKVLLALKCFATWSVFDLMSEYMDGSTSSSLYEVRLGDEKFGGETHAYSVAYADHEIDEVVSHADKIIFNSLSQLERHAERTAGKPVGLRLNPGVSSSGYDLADPARPFSRLGESDPARVAPFIGRLSGFMIHNNCDNRDFARFDALLGEIETRFGGLLSQVEWISLGGGIHFTADGYPLDAFCTRLRNFAEHHGVQVYLEPGEATISDSASLEVSVLDTLHNSKQLAVVDASTEAHMLDLLIYRLHARIEPDAGPHRYLIYGKSCLAGDIFGEFDFPHALEVGQRLSIRDAAGYTMVKKNWFNGLTMPSIVVRELDGTERVVRQFGYHDYLDSLS